MQSERRLRSQHVPAVRAASYCAAAVQTSIITEGFRSLAEGEQVEFFVESGDDGRTKAVQVTGPSGAPPQVLKPERAPVTMDCIYDVRYTAMWRRMHARWLGRRLEGRCDPMGPSSVWLSRPGMLH